MVQTSKGQVFVAVGSNIEPHENIPRAVELLSRQLKVEEASTFFGSRPLTRPEQGDFVNGVLRLDTDLPAGELKFGVLRKVEKELGRERCSDPHAARTMDLDLILSGDLRVFENDLKIPDPDIATREFVAIPLAELASDLWIPGMGSLRDITWSMSSETLRPDRQLSKRLREIIRRERKFQ